MKLLIYMLTVLVTDCIGSIISEYKNVYPQVEVNFTKLDLLQCQLRANENNTICAVRVRTLPAIDILMDQAGQPDCVFFYLDWCHNPVFHPGYVYSAKNVVSHTPPYKFYNYSIVVNGSVQNSWEIWEDVPIRTKPGASIRIVLSPSIENWSRIRLRFYDANKVHMYHHNFHPHNPIIPGIKTTLQATFGNYTVNVNVGGVLYQITTTQPVEDIRYLQLAFFDEPGEIHIVSYRSVS